MRLAPVPIRYAALFPDSIDELAQHQPIVVAEQRDEVALLAQEDQLIQHTFSVATPITAIVEEGAIRVALP